VLVQSHILLILLILCKNSNNDLPPQTQTPHTHTYFNSLRHPTKEYRSIKMLYTSQMEAIWIKISTERPINREETSRDSFRLVCEAFVQAQERPPFAGLSREIKSFIAERNIWAYYYKSLLSWRRICLTQEVGDDVPFPSVDLAAASPPTLNTTLIAQPLSVQQEFDVPSAQANRAAAAIKRKLLAKWQDKPYRQIYNPKFRWNPKTGEPWLAMRCYGEGAYPALSGEILSSIPIPQSPMINANSPRF